MLNKLIRIVSLAFIFPVPIIYLLIKFTNKEIETVTVTTNSTPIVILIAVSVLVIFFVSYVFSQTMAYIKDKPFGYGSIFFFGGLLGGVVVVGIMWLSKLEDLINYNVTQFMNDIIIYKTSMMYVLGSIILGLVIGVAGLVYEKTA